MKPDEDSTPLSREARRQRSEAAILAAARQQFSEVGFERATIRSVAGVAGVDPALVMQHFGSKEALFVAAARWPEEHERVLSATADELPSAALQDVFTRFESAQDREAAIALTRNCLTHPGATSLMRDEVMCDRMQAVTEAIGGEEAELRSALFVACLMGLSMARYVIELPSLAQASREDVARLLEPALRALVDGEAAGPAA